jgi:hypothetical protein
MWKPMKNLARHADFPCELIASWLIRGIHIGEMTKLGWPIVLVKDAILVDSVYFLYLLT